MTERASSWQAPERPIGPAPGIEFADFGPRLVAYIIDALIVGGVVIAAMLAWLMLAFVSGGLRADSLTAGSAVALGVLVLGLTVFGLGYFPWFWSRTGSTPGMRMMGLRVVRDEDGGPISLGQAIVRLLGYWLSGAALYVGYIWILIDKRRRGWHDLIAGTVVIKSR